MKYETYRLKAAGFPLYFKVATDKLETSIYLVRSDDKGDVLGSLEIHKGKPIDRINVIQWCNDWIFRLYEHSFDPKFNLEKEEKNER